MWELIHTSAPHGLRPNASGFCSVAWTHGMPANVISPLEQLSAYRLLYPTAEDPEGRRTPVELAFRKVRYGNQTLRVVSRIAGTRLDYTGRSNKIAHHLLLEPEERSGSPAGMAALCAVPENFQSEWSGEPALLALRHFQTAPAEALPEPGPALYAWCRALAADFLADGSRPFYVELAPETAPELPLTLIAGVIRCLPPERRDELTFSTYFTQDIPGCDCYLRCCTADFPALQRLRRTRSDRWIALNALRPAPAVVLPGECSASAAVPPENELPASAEGVRPPHNASRRSVPVSGRAAPESGESSGRAEGPPCRAEHSGGSPLTPQMRLWGILLLLILAAGTGVVVGSVTASGRKAWQEPSAAPLPAPECSVPEPAAAPVVPPPENASVPPPPVLTGEPVLWSVQDAGKSSWRFKCGSRSFLLPVPLWNSYCAKRRELAEKTQEAQQELADLWNRKREEAERAWKEAAPAVAADPAAGSFLTAEPRQWNWERLARCTMQEQGGCGEAAFSALANALLLRDALSGNPAVLQRLQEALAQWQEPLLRQRPDLQDAFAGLQEGVETQMDFLNGVAERQKRLRTWKAGSDRTISRQAETKARILQLLEKNRCPEKAATLISEKLQQEEPLDETTRLALETTLNEEGEGNQ